VLITAGVRRQEGDAVSVISVQLDDLGPAQICVRQRDRLGHEFRLEREDPYLLEAEEGAFDRLLGQGLRLPRGTIDVLVGQDEFWSFPTSAEVGAAIAERAAFAA
jgi:hypothetical protein